MKTTAIIIAGLSLAALTCCYKKPKDTRLPEPEVRKEKAANDTSAPPPGATSPAGT